MKTLIRWCLAAGLALLAPLAHAAYSCTISSPGFSTAYLPTAGTTTIVQTSFTINCTRALSDAANMSYSVGVDNGIYANGTNNRAASGANYLRYDLYKDSACGTQWKGNSKFSGTLAFSGSTSAALTATYWGCIPAGQTGLPAGTYSDIDTMTLSYGPNPQATATGTSGVSIATPATCSVTTAPGDIVFNYTSLGPAVNASTTYGVTCTAYLPYTMALDASSGTLVGVTYTLALPAASATGNGVQQLHTVNGTVGAGQSGSCAVATCSASQPRTLTISY